MPANTHEDTHDDAWLETIAAIWSYHREALLIPTVTIVALLLDALPRAAGIPLTILAVYAVWRARHHILQYLHTSRVRRQWARAVISSGAAARPTGPSRKSHSLSGPKATHVKQTPIGDLLTVKVGKGRGTVDTLTKHRDQLAADLDTRFNHVTAVRIEPSNRASRANVLIVRGDPFQNRDPIPWPLRHHQQLSMWEPVPIGVDENGNAVPISLVEKNLLIGGEPGAGKSAALSLIAATAALDPDTRLYLLDGKRVELAAWAPAAEASIGPQIGEANIVLRHLRGILEERTIELLAAGIRKVERSPTMPLHVLICDELALYLQDEDKDARALFAEQLRDLISRGRACGIIVIAATQKPSADIIPSSIRDLMALRLALRCTTPQASDTILGQGWATNDADASSIPIGQRGVGWLLAEGERPHKLKGYYLTDEDIATISSRATAGRATAELAELLGPSEPETHSIDEQIAFGRACAPPDDHVRRRHLPTPPTSEGRSPEDAVTRVLPKEGEGLTRSEWAAQAGRSQWKYLSDDAAALLESGAVVQSGDGVRGSPYRYRLSGNGSELDWKDSR